jgi:hypothetical protein
MKRYARGCFPMRCVPLPLLLLGVFVIAGCAAHSNRGGGPTCNSGTSDGRASSAILEARLRYSPGTSLDRKPYSEVTINFRDQRLRVIGEDFGSGDTKEIRLSAPTSDSLMRSIQRSGLLRYPSASIGLPGSAHLELVIVYSGREKSFRLPAWSMVVAPDYGLVYEDTDSDFLESWHDVYCTLWAARQLIYP